MIKHVLSLALVAAVLPASASARADGGRIYFLRNQSIFAVDPAVGTPVLVRQIDGCNLTALAVSRDGSRIVDADNCGSGYQIKLAAVGSGDIQTLTGSADGSATPSFSPDGTRIAFQSNRDSDQEIYVMGADGSGQTRLTDRSGADLSPVFSPDGARIAFVRDGDVWTMRADGGDAVQLTNTPVMEREPAYSPDGGRIAFMRRSGSTYRIWAMNIDGSAQVQLTPDGFYSDSDPSYSPDGTKIVFSSGRDNDLGLFVMNADGSAPARLTSGPDSDALPAWAVAPPSGGGGSEPPPVVVTQPPAIAPAPPVVTAPAPAPAKRFAVRSRKLRVKKGIASLTLDVPGAGRARASGKGLRTGDASARRAGKLTIALRLTSAILRHLRRAHTVKLRLDVRFTPVGGAASDLRVTVTCDGSV